MVEFDEADLRALEELNELRAAGSWQGLRHLERRFNSRFGAERRLAVYGSLAPGEANHHQISRLRGEWIAGLTVRGRLYGSGWGAGRGFPGLRWSASEAAVPVRLFVSPDLPRHWGRLDRFEGEDYRRILVPLYRGTRVAQVANLYEVRELGSAVSLVGIGREGEIPGFEGELPAVAEEAIHATVALYGSARYVEPWIGYLALSGSMAVGTCGFKSAPAGGRVEIAYFTFPGFEGRGFATAMAAELLAVARRREPDLVVAAQTLPERGASTRILEKLGFELAGTIDHPEDGPVWEWRAAPLHTREPTTSGHGDR